MNNNASARAAILGATGYTGQELLRLLRRHGGVRVAAATSESQAGAAVPGHALKYVRSADVSFGDVDVVFSCLPTGESGAVALRAHDAGARVVDLSADLRHANGAGAGLATDSSAGRPASVYGLTELNRAVIRGATLVANPGCYPTGIVLMLAPLLRAGALDTSRATIIDAASGVTGAGRGAKRDLLFGEVAEDYRAYGVGNGHRHVPEIGQELAVANGGTRPPFVFTPHLLPVRRGILETLYLPVPEGVTAAQLTELTRAAYAGERFVEVLADGLPSLRDVVGTNRVALGFADVTDAGAALVLGVVAFDNLLKGASGQALQNANLMLGLCEGEGLAA
jgi:N-acetyl-gamma-glutamyl-phosphate reductase